MNYRALCFFLFGFYFSIAQTNENDRRNGQERTFGNQLENKEKKEEYPISLYKIISVARDTSYFDTTLTIQKEYKHNYIRKDDFELLPFSNVAQPYNKLGYGFANNSLYPQLGARGKHYGYWEVEDVFYYHVPTPTTELFFKSVMEQGQVADGFITVNTSEQFNFSIANKGLRSLGQFQNIRSSNNNFRFTASYFTKNRRYALRAHIVAQDLENQENGGIANRDQFESEDSEFRDRSRIDVNFQDAVNILNGKRYYFDHYFTLSEKKDSLSFSRLRLEHTFNYETKFYDFNQTTANTFFGEAFQASNLVDRSQLRSLFNKVNLDFSNDIIGNIKATAVAYNYNYSFRSIVFTDDGIIPSNLEGDEIGFGGEWTKTLGKVKLHGDFITNISGDLGGTSINARASYNANNGSYIKAHAFRTSRQPNFNFLLNQSNYIQYNWLNTDVFENEERTGLGLDINLNKWLNLKAEYSVIDNYTYFGENPLSPDDTNPQIAPFQSNESITYLKLRLSNEFKFGKLALNNTIMYQNVDQEGNILNVPEIVTRNTLYFSDHLFDKALYLQTGFTFKYFTSYFLDGYNPLIAEFFSQDNEEFGDFPLIDFFINVKVRRTRFYLKAEHFNSPFTGNNFYSAPDYPYRDFIVRFGLVWNFFI